MCVVVYFTVVCCHSLRCNNYFDMNILYGQCSYVMQAVRNNENKNCRYYWTAGFLQTIRSTSVKICYKPNNLKAGWLQHRQSLDFWTRQNNRVSCYALCIILVLYNKGNVKEQGRKLRGNIGNYLRIDTMLEYLSPYSGRVLSHGSVSSEVVHFWHISEVIVAAGILRM
jgi:hypothetical protein